MGSINHMRPPSIWEISRFRGWVYNSALSSCLWFVRARALLRNPRFPLEISRPPPRPFAWPLCCCGLMPEVRQCERDWRLGHVEFADFWGYDSSSLLMFGRRSVTFTAVTSAGIFHLTLEIWSFFIASNGIRYRCTLCFNSIFKV
jgi:hypothetical protein